MVVRQLQPSDFAEIVKIWIREIYDGAIRLVYSREDFIIKTYDDLATILNAPDLCLLGLEDSSQIAGAIIGFGNPKLGIYYCPLIWVSPARRNQHHGTMLAQLLHKWALERGYEKFAVETGTRMPIIKQLLKNLGFHQTRTVWFKVENGSTTKRT